MTTVLRPTVHDRVRAIVAKRVTDPMTVHEITAEIIEDLDLPLHFYPRHP